MMSKKQEFYPKFMLLYQISLVLIITSPLWGLLLSRLFFRSMSFLSIGIMIFLSIKFLIYETTVFSITDSTVQYKRDFFTLLQKNLRYRDIKEITLHRNILQRMFGLGTVKVISHATTENAGIILYDIEEYQEIYNILMDKINNNSYGNHQFE